MTSTCSIRLLSHSDSGFDVTLSTNDYDTSSRLTVDGSVVAMQQRIRAIVDEETADDRIVAWNVLHEYEPSTFNEYGLELTEVSVGTRMDRAPTASIPMTTFRK